MRDDTAGEWVVRMPVEGGEEKKKEKGGDAGLAGLEKGLWFWDTVKHAD